MCKHVAASLYGVGARLDQNPELLFLLRGVDPAEFISRASAAEAVRQPAGADGAAAMSETEIADVFGIELAAPAPVSGHADISIPKPAGAPKPPAKNGPQAKESSAPRGQPARKRRRPGENRRPRAGKVGEGQSRTEPRPAGRTKMSEAAKMTIAAAVKARRAAAKTAARSAA